MQLLWDFFLILKEMIFIASISTYVSLYNDSTTGNYIILKECIRLCLLWGFAQSWDTRCVWCGRSMGSEVDLHPLRTLLQWCRYFHVSSESNTLCLIEQSLFDLVQSCDILCQIFLLNLSDVTTVLCILLSVNQKMFYSACLLREHKEISLLLLLLL